MSTQETIDETLRQFEIMVLELIQMGYSASRAVQIAYKHYPIMEVMESPLIAEMVQNFERGYHSVLVPNQGVIPYSSPSIGEAMKSAWTADGLTLSKRLHGRSKKVKRDVANTIDAAIKQGKNSIAMARDIFSGYGDDGVIPPAELPNYIDKVRKLKPPPYTNKKAVQEHKRILRSTERKIKQNSTPSLRAAYSELTEAVEKESAIAVSKAVTVATQEKARYHAERIARTENARAYADGQMLRYIDDDDVVALKWRLSSRHPVHDICDFWANADLYGLGKGIYPKDKFPIMPAHPHCFCLISPIYDFELDITKAKDNIDEGAMNYLRSLNKREQENMLGIHGRTLVMSGKESWRNKLRGFNITNFKVRKPKADNITQAQPLINKPKGEKLDSRYIVDREKLNTKQYRDEFESLSYGKNVNNTLHREAVKCFNVANGRNIERMALIDARTGKTIDFSIGDENSNKVKIKEPKDYLGKPNSIVVIHNHPNNSGFSRTDILSYIQNKEIKGGVVVNGIGKIYSVSDINRNNPVEDLFRLLYNENKEIYGVNKATTLALKKLHEKGWLVYEEKGI